ncbi:GNAT family N-acetyltransferase [Nocardioides sp. zg-1228]|uniref:GNAT family N-acetyltransferase n=1 Tax=Nocardioides sp. zg-1228 TaxID=2763008 RepID=UPI001642E359|nr:GNAT family N-acetyltransferase [Nocardioides sp. zg-1228]MBC2932005.1 GNAT family N-acetyltransferase [Nocardioides sp. zg-1228]QSF57559.1 GNAT family N-acetyltransferase [Nocardioides sp. zg-1228]
MSTRAATLPEGLTTRPLRRSDAGAVHRLMVAQELEDIGQVAIEEADIVSDWARPSHDLAARSVGVLDGDTLVAYAELTGADRADTAVLPSHRGRGIGTWLARWLVDLGRDLGSPAVGMPVPQGSPGDRLLESLGFRVRWTSWVLRLPEGATVPARPLPEGYVVRTAAAGEVRAAHDVLEDAFLEWSVREREPFEDFEAATTGRPGFEPWNLRVALDPDGTVVGVSLVLVSDEGTTAYVDRLAVRRDQRRRGIAQALLVDSFARGREHGTRTFELGTDSRTGALPMYERVGMAVEQVWVNRAIDLR